MTRAGAVAAISALVALVAGVAPAGAVTADPAVTNATRTVKTTVNNAGHGGATPDSFVFHVFDPSSNDVADGIFNHNGTTNIKLPPGVYRVTEDAIEPFTEHTANCSDITISVAHPKTCTVTNVWTPSTITVSTAIDNTGGGTANASAFHYTVLDSSDNSIVKHGTFNASGTTSIGLVNSGTYSITEDQHAGYIEDYSQCSDLTVDYQNPQVCAIGNTFDPHTTTSQSNTSTTAPGAKQVNIHGSTSGSNSCLEQLSPKLQDDTNANIQVTVSADAFPNPHEGDPIKLTNTNVSIATPASLIQLGVDAGIINAGDKIPDQVTFVIGGASTKEVTRTFKFTVVLTIVVKNGQAEPLVVKAALPDTTWTPSNSTDPVFFAEHSLILVSKITAPALGGAVTSTFSCPTPNAFAFLSLAAQPGQIATSTTGGSGGSGGGSTGSTATPGVLPVTGTSVWLWVAPGVLFIYLGLLAIGTTARKRRRQLSR
jgi:hypothetical protein